MKIEQQGNNSLRVLSVLTAILMPPTLVTGVFGMNTKGLPFTDLDTAFLWASLLMVLSSVRCLPHHEAHRDHQVV
jgi:zinc transporter